MSVIALLMSFYSHAQGENNIWASGRYAGLDFSSGAPQFFPSQSFTAEGCATICDVNGSLLFYSNGNSVWNKNHHVMLNGEGILGNSGASASSGSSTQGVSIVPFIADTNKYFIFTLDCDENINPPQTLGYLRYSVVDMSLNNGLGDVLPDQKNIVMDSGMSEKMFVAKGSNCFFWLVTHKYGSSEFKCFKTADEIVQSVTSYASSYSIIKPEGYMGGEMKISPDHKMIASTSGESMDFGVELFSFDNKTGIVSNPMKVYSYVDPIFIYGISFSPDSKKLYIGTQQGIGDQQIPLYQLDLTLLPDVAKVRNSLTSVGEGTWGGMRIGPDNKIYITAHNSNKLHYINKPNEKGKACELTSLDFSVADSVYFMLGFGNEVFSRKKLFEEKGESTDSFICKNYFNSEIRLNASSGYEEYMWSTGSRDSFITVSKPGVYAVTAKNDCGTVIDSFTVYDYCAECGYAPTAFTPNSDGINDYFKIIGNVFELVKLKVYDRWGNEVFYSKDISKGWDGNYKGKPCENGAYYYLFSVRCAGVDLIYTKTGDVTLLR